MNGDKIARTQLTDGLKSLGFKHPAKLTDRLMAFGELLIQENRRTNLVGVKNLDDLVAAHFLDSLAVPSTIGIGGPVIDVGSGAGLPGIPIALSNVGLRVALLEPRAKRFNFLKNAVASLAIVNAEVYKITAESAARASWMSFGETVVMRAVGSPMVAIEIGLPLVRRGGRLLLYQGKANLPGAAELSRAIKLGGEFLETRRVFVPYLEAVRHVWVIEKRRATTRNNPRRDHA